MLWDFVTFAASQDRCLPVVYVEGLFVAAVLTINMEYVLVAKLAKADKYFYKS